MPSDHAAVGPLRGGLALHLGSPLAGTAAALASVPAAPVRARGKARAQQPAPAAQEPRDPAAHLARLMDLHGSVALARELGALDAGAAAPPALPGPTRSRAPAAAALRALVEDRLGELVAGLRRTFDEPFHRRNRLPGPAELHALLEQSGALGPGRRSRPMIGGAAWEPFGELAERAFGKIRYELGSLRAEIVPALRALGPDAARLERLDAVISAATEKGRDRVLAELGPALGGCFGQALAAALAALPEDAGLAEVQTWFADGGWIRAEMERIRRVVEAVLAHRARRLLALVEAGSARAS